MKVTCSKSGAASVIKVEDRMDAQSCPEFEKACQRLLQDGEKLLVIDFAGLVLFRARGCGPSW
jgi:anti-anti-sigma regulatory factor